ncbi:predicted protein [Postia placenta Mad-698-R]|uniref:Uncharacterized protein n=1 Tax=Postia placenta MAD-698-R-SB12 TaxID=670580 RepID=A0A1X6MK28_9APHY|nr:hypothetical protein POSPLADRAFT_1050737 [Postia placenta MAD-698-R-SB12]EED81811.1 predicted protein [Postia placenta Mad-698-R]OSX56552.1 hypothetical protein POSPLADRAFT_1050737 [Postia placenta MAD-698-R-SB12]
MLLPLLSPLIPQLVRWSECEINTGETTERTNFAALGTLNSASRLEALRVGVRGCSGIDPLAMEGEFFNSPTFMLMPTSRSDALRDVCITCAVRTFLAHIDAPRLIELYLEHTNVDFPIQYDPYAGSTEDGDSDDEANDFSQSPWSDHATGMGLRALMQRSKPQLEVLEMTYADMRTKDFLWCFEQLNALREFRIVASDMSDTVIQALAPVVSPDQPHALELLDVFGDRFRTS